MIPALWLALALAGSAPEPADSAAPDAQAAPLGMRTTSVSRVFAHWPDYVEIDEADRARFTLRYRLSGPDGWSLWLEQADGRLERIGGWPDRYVTPPPLDHFERDANLHVDAPSGAMGVSLEFAPSTPMGTQIEAAALTEALAQANTAMRAVAGAAALFAPRMDTVVFVFEDIAPEAWAILETGERIALPAEERLVRFPARERRFRRTERLEFGVAPQDALLTPR